MSHCEVVRGQHRRFPLLPQPDECPLTASPAEQDNVTASCSRGGGVSLGSAGLPKGHQPGCLVWFWPHSSGASLPFPEGPCSLQAAPIPSPKLGLS